MATITTLTLQPDGTDGVDNYLRSDSPTTNNGTLAFLFFGEDTGSAAIYRPIIKFDLSSIPSGAHLLTATLNFWIRNVPAATRTLRVFRINVSWTEAGSTWNSRNGTNNWTTAGAGAAADAETIDIGRASVSSGAAQHDKTAITLDHSKIEEMITGGSFTNNGFKLQFDTESNDTGAFYSSDEATFTAERPQLVITYSTETPTTLVLQPDATDGLDALIQQANPTTNEGTNTSIQVGEDNAGTELLRSVIKFSGISTIPVGSTISTVTLTLTYTEAGSFRSSNNRVMRLFRLLRAWSESQVTWNVYTTGNSWSTAGAGNTSTDREPDQTGYNTLNTADSDESEKAIKVNPVAVQQMVDGSFTNNGWLMQMDTESNDRYFFHSSDSATSSKRPKLTIVYFPPASRGGSPMFFSGGAAIG